MIPEPRAADAGEDAFIGVGLGRRIRAARTAAGLSMRALAGAAEVSQPFLSQIESGQTMPSIVTLFKLANVLHLSPSDLLPSAAETDPVAISRRGDASVAVTESDDAATSRIITSPAGRGGRGATVQEYRIERTPYTGDWFESDGENTVYVAAGTLVVTIDGRGDFTLEAGDALTHPGALRNRWSAPRGPVTVLLVHTRAG